MSMSGSLCSFCGQETFLSSFKKWDHPLQEQPRYNWSALGLCVARERREGYSYSPWEVIHLQLESHH